MKNNPGWFVILAFLSLLLYIPIIVAFITHNISWLLLYPILIAAAQVYFSRKE
jgi:hypothetical protein